MAWYGIPCRIRAHFGFELDEQDTNDLELDRSHGELANGIFYSALDGAEPHSKNYGGNGSGRVAGTEIDPFPRSFGFTPCFENRGE